MSRGGRARRLAAGLPAWMLLHHVHVEPYVEWGVYGPSYRLDCTVRENLAGGAGPAGTERVAHVTLYARLDADVPPGSRVTMADGRKGYAAAIARHDGGGLPTPDHLQIAVSVAGAYGPAYGEQIHILYRATRHDDKGAARITWRREPVDGVAVRTLSSSEAPVGTVAVGTDTVEVILPPGTPISTRDRLEVRGLLYDVDGTPTEVQSSLNVARPGVKVIGKRRST